VKVVKSSSSRSRLQLLQGRKKSRLQKHQGAEEKFDFLKEKRESNISRHINRPCPRSGFQAVVEKGDKGGDVVRNPLGGRRKEGPIDGGGEKRGRYLCEKPPRKVPGRPGDGIKKESV